MPPRKTAPVQVQDAAPGPIRLEVRADDKIRYLQRVHAYTIDQQDDQTVITCVLKQNGHTKRPYTRTSDDG